MTMLSAAELQQIADLMRESGTTVGRLQAERITSGRSNLTFKLFDDVSPAAWVLRMPPRHGRTPSAHDVGREYRVTSALHSAGFPAPPPTLFSEDESILGAPFAVNEFVSGFSWQRAKDLSSLSAPQLAAVADALVDTLAELHAVDYQQIGLADFGRPDDYAARQLRRWSGQWQVVGASRTECDGPATELISWLESHIPRKQQRTAIVHGDYRLDNTLVRLDPHPHVAAVVDWELSTIGDPVADVAMMCAYRSPALDLILGEGTAWTSPLLPSAPALAEKYVNASGSDLPDWEFHQALALFKIAVIAAGIDYRQQAGSGAGVANRSGEAVLPFLLNGLSARP